MTPAGAERPRKERLLRMVDLAQVYRGCSKNELASLLDRDPAKIVPDSGNPKLDLVFNMADILDWPVGDVAEALWGRHSSRRSGDADRPEPTGTFAEIDQQARDAHRRGDYREMRWLGEHLLDMATTAVERAGSMIRIGSSWSGEGRYVKALEWFQGAANEHEVPDHIDRMVRVNLASAHLSLWNLVESDAIAAQLVEELRANLPKERRTRVVFAHALYVLGATGQRRVQLMESSQARAMAESAITALREGRDRYLALADEFRDSTYAGVANTCTGGLIELAVETGNQIPEAAIKELSEGLTAVIDPSAAPGDMLESWGWWCVAGLNIALRHLRGDSRERAAAVFSNKAFELADATGSWSLRERAFCLSFLSAEGQGASKKVAEQLLLDSEDLRALVGAMGRFPRFRQTGWGLLRAALERTG